MADRRIQLTPILLEAFFVVLGVSLALAGNEWRERMNKQDHATHAHASILEEIQTNRDATQASRTYHQTLLDSLNTYIATNAGPPSLALFRDGFFRPTTALTTAWEAASATDAVSYMAYEDVLMFSRLYTMQRRYEISAMNAGSVLYAEIMRDGVPGVVANYRNLTYIIGGFWHLEGLLLDEYDRVLAELGDEAPADGATTDSTAAS